MVGARVLQEELITRQCTLASKSSLGTYGKALVPPVGSVATYLLHSRNREGAWIRCRLRSSTLPVMQVLSRQCRPQRSEEHATCLLCPQSAEVETTEHFLSSCQSPSQCQLRRELCSRLEQALQQWHEAQRLALMADSSGPPPAAAALAVSVRLATASATSGYDTLTAMLQCMRTGVATSEAARVAWCELLLGRCSDAVTGESWDASLLDATMRPIHNFLLLAWRARAAQLGGVPTLNPSGRGFTVVPYRRMKSIGVRPTSKGRR